jgi:hypothetical protein
VGNLTFVAEDQVEVKMERTRSLFVGLTQSNRPSDKGVDPCRTIFFIVQSDPIQSKSPPS